MTDSELDAVRMLAPAAPTPTTAVLAAAMKAAGLEAGTTDPGLHGAAVETLALTPRRPRRTRRRMVSLTVALASTGVAAAVVAALVLAGGASHVAITSPASGGPQPSGLSFPTDAQLRAMRWFHVSTTDKTASCPGIRQVWFDRTNEHGIYRLEEGTSREDPCAPVDLPQAKPYFGEQPRYILDLVGLFDTDAELRATMVAGEKDADGTTADDRLFHVVAASLTETPLNTQTREQLLALLLTVPGAASVEGTDGLGRPVQWVTCRDGGTQTWLGFDEVYHWLIASSVGPAGGDGGPARKGGYVTAIDTSAPTPIVETGAEAHPSPAEIPQSSDPLGTPAP